MENSNKISVNDIPGIGEVRAREGTDIAVISGAAKHWHTKYKESRNTWLVRGFVLGAVSFGVGKYVWSLIHGH